MTYIDECKQMVDELVEETVKATQNYIDTELDAPTNEQLNAMIADHEIRKMRMMEQNVL